MGQLRVGLMNMQLWFSEVSIIKNDLFSMSYVAVFDSRIYNKTTILTLLVSYLKIIMCHFNKQYDIMTH